MWTLHDGSVNLNHRARGVRLWESQVTRGFFIHKTLKMKRPKRTPAKPTVSKYLWFSKGKGLKWLKQLQLLLKALSSFGPPREEGELGPLKGWMPRGPPLNSKSHARGPRSTKGHIL